jgi:hypothetical protein
VYENSWKFVFLITIGCLFTISSIYAGFIWGAIFFGICTIANAYPIFDPKKQIIFFGTDKYKKHIKEDFEKRYSDTGIFLYNALGFKVSFKSGDTYDVNWSDIETILAYKIDLYTFDSICLEVFFNEEKAFRITEETDGWYKFLEKISETFPQIKKGWEFEIIVPAFKENLTIIFDRSGKTFEQINSGLNSTDIQ